MASIFSQLSFESFLETLNSLDDENDDFLALISNYGSIFSQYFRNYLDAQTEAIMPHLEDLLQQIKVFALIIYN